MLKESDLDAIDLGLRKQIEIWCPAKENIHKNELVKIGYDLLGNKIFDTWSCYSNGSRNTLNEPAQCGTCESCVNRKSSFKESKILDKTIYAI
jgi:7-cyano-7-deazaguanine synthase